MAKRKHQQSIKFYQEYRNKLKSSGQNSGNSEAGQASAGMSLPQYYVMKAKYLVKHVWQVSIPGFKQIFLYWLPIFTALNFFWPPALIARSLCYRVGKFFPRFASSRFAKPIQNFDKELEKFTTFLFKSGQLNIVDSLCTVCFVVAAILDGIKVHKSHTMFQLVLHGEWADTDLELSLRSVTVSRNYCLAMLVIFAFCKVVKYMRAILSVFADTTVGIFVVIYLIVITAFGLAAQVAFFDRDTDQFATVRSSWMHSFLGSSTDYVFSNNDIEAGSYGFAGFYVVVTQLIGSLILNNLVVNVLGERYAAASEQLVKSKRKLHVQNLKNHGRHLLLSKLYFRKDPLPPSQTLWQRCWSWLPRPFFPWLSNQFDSYLDGSLRQKNIGLHYYSVMKILRIPESARAIFEAKKKRKQHEDE